MGQASKIAIRYCCVRRQFQTLQGTKEERKVIDYQTTSFSGAKLNCRYLTTTLAGNWCSKEFQLMMYEVNRKVFTRMDQVHHILSGFKAIFSNQAMLDIEEARRLCGGAGYQSNAGFTQIFAALSPMPTYEGENTVMMGQASRYLVKLVGKVVKKTQLDFPFTYLNNMQSTLSLKNQARTVDDFLNIEILDRAL